MNKHTQFIVAITLLILFFMVSISCKDRNQNVSAFSLPDKDIAIIEPEMKQTELQIPDFDTSKWVDLQMVLKHARFDIKYASTDNFTEKQIYDCARCLVRKELAPALISIESSLYDAGYGMLIFDCYRPAPYQQKLWDIKPDARYVMPPSKGSNHSRGTAIDLTLFYLVTGEELDMGSAYDFFGEASHTDHTNFDLEVLQNRERLQSTMKKYGFRTIRTEWWHFDFNTKKYDPDDFLWSCP